MIDLILKRKNLDILFILLLIIGTIFSSNQNLSLNITFSANLNSILSNLDVVNNTQNVQSNMNSSDCVKKFIPIISTLSSNCQSRIVSSFNQNVVPGRCCTPANFTSSIRDCLKADISSFTNSMTKISQSNKLAFSCYKNNEVFKILNKLPLSKEEIDNDNTFLKGLLLGYNNLNHLMSKCLSALNNLSLNMLTRMCLPSTSLPNFFKKDSSGNYASILKLKQDDLDIQKSCTDYLRNHTQITNVLLNSYVDQVNYLLGVDQCNYYSDFFNFDMGQDKNDIYFPNKIIPSAPETFNSLLDTWSNCTSTKSEFLSFAVSTLKTNIQLSQQANPNGLSTFIGRADINFDIIKRTFYLEKYPSFHVKCDSNTCTAYCLTCNGLIWDNTKVVSGSNIKSFDTSCCNGVCVVYIQLVNPNVSGSEVFKINGDSSTRNADKLLTEKLANAQFCFDNKKNFTANLRGPNSTYVRSNNTINNTSNNTIRNFSNVNFTNSKLKSVITDIQANPNNYNLDFRLGSALNLLIQPYNNNTRVTLMNFLNRDLYARNNSFYFACENGNCTYQCKNCSDSNSTFALFPNNTMNPIQAPKKLLKKSGSSGSKSSGSSTKSGGSSTKSGGSSLTGGSTKSGGSSSNSGGSTKSGGSSLTGGSSSNSGGSTKSGGSSLAGGSSSYGASNTNLRPNSGPSSNQPTLSGQATKLQYNQPSSSTSQYSGYSSSMYYPSTKSNINVNSNTYSYNKISVNTYSNNYNSNFQSSYSNSFSSRSTVIITTKYYSMPTYYYTPITRYSIRYYTYRPTYYTYYSSDMYYSPSWGFYSSYYMPNYNFMYYRAPSPYSNLSINNPSADLRPNYNPLDWMPSSRLPFDISTYMTNINNKINSIKLYVECCSLFCVTYLESFDDGYTNPNDSRNRVFLDFNMRNYLFLDSAQLIPKTKKCMMDNLYSRLENGTITNNQTDQYRSLNITNSCEIETPYKTFPLKNSCRNELSQYCGLNNFDQLIERFFPKTYNSQCSLSLLCPNITDSSSEDDRARCGDLLSTNFMSNNYRVSYTSLAFPCHASNNAPKAISSLIQTHMMKSRLSQSNTTSLYVNETNLSSTDKSEISSVQSAVNQQGNITVVIDNNSNLAANTNVDIDLGKINSNVQASTMQSSSSAFSKLSGFILILALFLI